MPITAPRIALRSPDLYLDWERERPLPIVWDTYSNVTESAVRIDLYRDSANGPEWVKVIAASVPDTGSYIWIPANDDIDYGTYGWRIEVSLVSHPTALDRSTESFAVPENTTEFYVNDFSTIADQYTTVAGDNRQTGRIPGGPKPYPNNVLRIYQLNPGHTLYVDSGNYALLSPLVISNLLEVGDDEGFTLTGPSQIDRTATFRHANPFTVAPILELNDADFMTIGHLTLQNGQFGLLAHHGSTSVAVNHVTARGNALDGIRLESGSSATELTHLTVVSNQRHGLYLDSSLNQLSESLAHGNGGAGFYLVNPGSPLIEGNETYSNSGSGLQLASAIAPSITGNRAYNNGDTGFSVSAGAGVFEANEAFLNRVGIVVQGLGGTLTIGNADLSLQRGNKVYDNLQTGISASGSALVIGNTVSGHSGTGDIGISAVADVALNVVFGNFDGIVGSGLVRENRVYRNTGLGIRSAGTVRGNVVYSNAIGFELSGAFVAVNNLVYANSVQGAGLSEGPAARS